MILIKQPKAIYIPADSITLGISRSFYIENNLSKKYNLYSFRWEDPREFQWSKNHKNIFSGIICLFRNLLKKKKIIFQSNRYIIEDSFLLNIAFPKIIGKTNAFKLMTYYNTLRLESWIREINPDIIFFMDGNYYFNYPNNFRGITVTDIQDDFTLENLSNTFRNYIIKRGNDLYSKINIRFAVSESTCISMNRYFNQDFLVLENGANIFNVSTISNTLINNEIQSLGLKNKIILTYIGSIEKYDIVFVEKLMLYLSKELPNLVLITIGNVPRSNVNNIINLGPKHPDITNLYYSLSDIGLILKDTSNNPFLFNSVPLKILQYSAYKKHVITFPIQWIYQNDFPNVHTVVSENLENWKFVIQNVLTSIKSDVDFSVWNNYDWSKVCNIIFENIDKLSNVDD